MLRLKRAIIVDSNGAGLRFFAQFFNTALAAGIQHTQAAVVIYLARFCSIKPPLTTVPHKARFRWENPSLHLCGVSKFACHYQLFV